MASPNINDLQERLLASARRQLAALEADFDAARTESARTGEALRLTQQHADNLENLRSALQKRIVELDEQCAHLTRTISERDAAIAGLRHAEAGLRSLEASFFWRLTAFCRKIGKAKNREIGKHG